MMFLVICNSCQTLKNALSISCTDQPWEGELPVHLDQVCSQGSGPGLRNVACPTVWCSKFVFTAHGVYDISVVAARFFGSDLG